MIGHTEEPWSYGEDNDGWYVSTGDTQLAHGMTEADARRIVACVNACKGIDTDSLEADGYGDDWAEIGRQRIEILEQHDELLAALQVVQPILDKAFEYDGDVFGMLHNDAVDADILIREVIAKVTGVKP